MKKIPYLQITFQEEIHPSALPQLRGNIVELVGREHVLYHNHLGDKLRYSYPLIQYKTWNKKGVLVCFNQGADEAQLFLQKKEWLFNIQNKPIKLSLHHLEFNHYTLGIWQQMFNYKAIHWIGLNQHNYKKYKTLSSLAERVQFLEQILTGNILSMARGLNVYFDKQIQVSINNINKETWLNYKGQKVKSFTFNFCSNVSIPKFAGLGKGVSRGFGIIRKLNINSTEQ